IFSFIFTYIQKITGIRSCSVLHTQTSMKKSNKSPADRAAINRINARLSTGPRTDKGKASSRLNALRHTLCSQTVVSSNNNIVAYVNFQKRFFDDLQPKGIIEEQLVQTLTDCSWRLNCARIYETSLITLGTQAQV